MTEMRNNLPYASPRWVWPDGVQSHGLRGVAVAILAAVTAAGGAFVTALFLFPSHQVMPAAAASLLLAASATALVAWIAPREAGGARLVFWDIAGAMTAIGLCAALLGEPEPAVAFIERNR